MTSPPETVIVTRHLALVEYLIEQGVAPRGATVLPRATARDVAGKRVVGVLPLHLAALAASVVVVPLDTPDDLRGAELSLAQVREFASPAQEYVIQTAEAYVRTTVAALEAGAEGGPYPTDLPGALLHRAPVNLPVTAFDPACPDVTVPATLEVRHTTDPHYGGTRLVGCDPNFAFRLD